MLVLNSSIHAEAVRAWARPWRGGATPAGSKRTRTLQQRDEGDTHQFKGKLSCRHAIVVARTVRTNQPLPEQRCNNEHAHVSSGHIAWSFTCENKSMEHLLQMHRGLRIYVGCTSVESLRCNGADVRGAQGARLAAAKNRNLVLNELRHIQTSSLEHDAHDVVVSLRACSNNAMRATCSLHAVGCRAANRVTAPSPPAKPSRAESRADRRINDSRYILSS